MEETKTVVFFVVDAVVLFFNIKTMVYNQHSMSNTGSTTTVTTWPSSGGVVYPVNTTNTVYVAPNTYQTANWFEKKKSLKEYMEKLRASERLILALKLFKEDKITEEQALEMIISDAQFYIE